MHHLANDPNTPEILRRAFAKVERQLIRRYDDGSEGVINMLPTHDFEAELAEHRKRIGRTMASGRKLIAVFERRV